jgi:hypothetical protein
LGAWVLGLWLSACGSKGSAGTAEAVPFEPVAKPGGGFFFVDPQQGGNGARLRLLETGFGRLVNVHALDESGAVDPVPLFRDFVVQEHIRSDGQDYALETNPITQATRLVILRRHRNEDGRDAFTELLRRAEGPLSAVVPCDPRGERTTPSLVARNATLVLHFDDALADNPEVQSQLDQLVRVSVGLPAERSFTARLLFDPNHGALIDGVFHSTRILIDTTVSAGEDPEQPLNTIGLPKSELGSTAPNVLVRLPTRPDPGSGQFNVLRNLAGVALTTHDAGPTDPESPTRDVLRALRSGNEGDPNNGFLLDLQAPEVVGEWNTRIETARVPEPPRAGVDFEVELRFSSVCRATPVLGDVLSTGVGAYEVSAEGSELDPEGRVRALGLRRLGGEPASSSDLLGNATFLTLFSRASGAPAECWLRFSPPPSEPPARGVASDCEIRLRFSEAMDPASLSGLGGFLLVSGPKSAEVTPHNLVVAETRPAGGGREYVLRPTLPLLHSSGSEETYHVRVEAPTDLAGNALAGRLPAIEFTLAAAQSSTRSLGTVLRFHDVDTLEPLGSPDLRGQFLFDLPRKVLRPRPVVVSSYAIDRSKPVVSIMTPGPLPIQTPLSKLGSKLQTLWRYCDAGWQVLDESKFNLDVIGLSWAPFGGRVSSDFFERFEIALGHSRYLPDEALSLNLPIHQNSGLNNAFSTFASNLLEDPRAPQKVVHPRALGYQIRPSELFVTQSGTILYPYPLNRGAGAPVTYTWRDTAVLAKGGPNGAGIPLEVEVGAPLNLEGAAGYVARPGQVPSIGLPLLMEIRCYPSDSAIGFNGFSIAFAVNSSALPSFRAYSTGGTDTNGVIVRREPDGEIEPKGGFNPRSTPPGKLTARSDDNGFYYGQLDVVPRLSRVHTIWIDSGVDAPRYFAPVVEPAAEDQPAGTGIELEYRGAHGFDLPELDGVLGRVVDESLFPFDARQLNAYGDIFAILPSRTATVDQHQVLGSAAFPGRVRFVDAGGTWTSDIRTLDGARYVQMRITFVGDLESRASASLAAIGIPFAIE